ncbi:1-aminocyclopropane-1-carboxylate deaminase [Flavitalea sp. BT771]|uniref:1-aminocyclopropane-1-carboxylate deaminase/D-cysteine desulfhydrase n=1 Tax=Flavitalea sp. BT771 TaxID=3063329 RepID=UPI0026E1706A|nr:1-aminocyclopropane-1-carboxylate deaminase [Flavitalea sp. BT771]MDO6432471.1 1-aminocyclopropane-1-carboxylate deaminase [Flavitalea sp. BT771]MDV6221380.1 1-aminocyclopropane-1-carboxylate deaminase [Flavitalea sp. BT771]
MKPTFNYPLSIQTVELPELAQHHVSMDVLRLDLIHPVISGNKWFKLKEWLRIAAAGGGSHLITFGGAWSNHIIASAFAAREAGLSATGIIRGEKPARLSATLSAAAAYGMRLEFITRTAYRQKDDPIFLAGLSTRYPGAVIIPEGGAGEPGIKGSMDILREIDSSPYSHILCAVGTGTTFKGLSAAASTSQEVIGISALAPPYHFGGYARHTPELLEFMNHFYRTTGIPSDFVYTGKLFYATLDMVRKDHFPPDSRLLVIHSGGLQGNRGLPPGLLYF